MRRLACLLVLALAGATAGRPASAANLLTNPTFGQDLSGWSLEPVAAPAWDPLDLFDSSGSGSARLQMVGDTTCCAQGILQYVSVVPGTQYNLAAWIQVWADPGVVGHARIFGSWYQQTGTTTCSGPISAFGSSAPVTEGEAGVWVLRNEVVTAPPNAHCALVKGIIYKSSPTGVFTAYLDDFVFAPAPDVAGLNIDFGTTYGVPASSYGAAAGQAGHWNLAGLGVTALSNLAGAPSGASVTVTADNAGGNNGSTPTNDDELLLNDTFFDYPSSPTWHVDFTGLTPGTYAVFLYAASNPNVPTGDMSVGGVSVSGIAGGSSALVRGISWTGAEAVVTGSTLAVSGTAVGSNYAGLAGIQIVRVPEPDPDTLFVSALACLFLLGPMRGRASLKTR